MNTGNLIFLAILFTLMLLALQRTERRRRWITLLGIAIPAFLIYQWAQVRGRTAEALIGAGIGLALNLIFWLLYGRRHPPCSSDREIKVIGIDD